MSISSISIGLSGMQANVRGLEVQAHNVANAATEGFSAQRSRFSEASPAGSGVAFSVAPPGAPGVDLAASMVQGIAYSAGFQLSAKVVSASNAMLGSLLDMTA